MKPSVVVGYDQTPASERALLEAASQAASREASLTVVTAFHWIAPAPPMPYAPTDVEQSVRESAAQIADHGAGIVRDRYPGLSVTALSQAGPTAETLASVAAGAEVLVVGNRGRGGFAGLLLGSVSMRALSAATVPTVIVRGSEHGARDLVVAAVDVADPGDATLEFAFAEADRRGARVEVVNAWDKPWFLENVESTESAGNGGSGGSSGTSGDAGLVKAAVRQIRANLEAELRTITRPWQAKYPEVRVTLRAADGSPGSVLTEASHRADLVVVGAHRRLDGRGMRVGPVAHAVAHHADCPVAVVPRG
jgi:nucleotide-binding universal stress UspA family protein